MSETTGQRVAREWIKPSLSTTSENARIELGAVIDKHLESARRERIRLTARALYVAQFMPGPEGESALRHFYPSFQYAQKLIDDCDAAYRLAAALEAADARFFAGDGRGQADG